MGGCVYLGEKCKGRAPCQDLKGQKKTSYIPFWARNSQTHPNLFCPYLSLSALPSTLHHQYQHTNIIIMTLMTPPLSPSPKMTQRSTCRLLLVNFTPHKTVFDAKKKSWRWRALDMWGETDLWVKSSAATSKVVCSRDIGRLVLGLAASGDQDGDRRSRQGAAALVLHATVLLRGDDLNDLLKDLRHRLQNDVNNNYRQERQNGSRKTFEKCALKVQR